MKTIVKRIVAVTLAFALAVAGASVVTNVNGDVQICHDGPDDHHNTRL